MYEKQAILMKRLPQSTFVAFGKHRAEYNIWMNVPGELDTFIIIERE